MTTHRTLLSFLIAAAIVWLTACGATPPSTDQPSNGGPTSYEPNVIGGVLTDQSGIPLADQQVSVGLIPTTASVSTLAPATAQRASVALTDVTGRFRISVESEGTYGISSVTDTAGAFTTVMVQRGADGALRQTSAVTMSTAPLGAITGTVDGPGAGVFVFALGTSFSAVTDSSGAFSISRVPAATYQVVAGTPGSVTTARSVTVSTGEVATVSPPIVFGPRVTSVDPQGFVTPEIDLDMGGVLVSPRTFTITGTGFGAVQGLSILRYAGTNVDAAIVSWSDTSIQVDVDTVELAGFPRYTADPHPSTFRFEVITAAGASASAPVGIVRTWLGLDFYYDAAIEPSDTRLALSAATFGGRPMSAVTYSIDVTNGSAHNSDDGSVIGDATTAPVDPLEWRPYGVTFDVRLASGLPAIVTVDPSGAPLFAAVEPTSVAVGGALDLSIDTAVLADGVVTVAGSLFGWNGVPMPDDGSFALEIAHSSDTEVTIAMSIAPNGTYVASGPAPAGWIDEWVDVRLVYRGFEIALVGAVIVE